MRRAPEPTTRPRLTGSLVLRLREGAPGIHTHEDVRNHLAAPASALDVAPVDRVLRRQSAGMLVTRAFASAKGRGRPGAGHRDFDDLEHELGLSRTFRVALSPDAVLDDMVAGLLALDEVEMASPVYLCESLPGAQPQPRPRPTAGAGLGPHLMIRAQEARAMEPGDPAVMIGLVDSGVALAHPELTRHLRPGVDTVELPVDAIPADMTLLSTPARRDHRRPEDDQGHGTGCASIMAAEGLGMAPGLAGLSPVIPGKALAAVRQRGARKATALGSLPDIDHAVKLIVDLGARVLNLSFGTPASALLPDDPVPHVDVIRYALSRGCTLVAASGNAGDDVPYYPAALPGVIAVISVDAAGAPSDFGSRGPHVAIAAPGEGVPMASIDGYTEGNGTSFAAPFVTAAAALMIARALRQSTPLSAETVRRLLRASARPFSSGVDAEGCGAGILDVPAALRAVDFECDLSPTPN